jgi:parallel beta-helix repeat protein
MFGLVQPPFRTATILLLFSVFFVTPTPVRAAVGDVPLVGDIDGDGKSDLIVWNAGTGTFRWVLSSAAYSDVASGSKQWGAPGDVPLIGDIDGDRKADLVVWRPSTATFYWLTSSSWYSTSAFGSKQWGDFQQPDVPLLGDVDGDGKADLFVWRQANGMFYWLTSSTGYSYTTGQGQKQWGGIVSGAPDVPLLKDADGDGKVDLFVWRPSNATFYWLTSSSGYSTNAFLSKQWGDSQQPDTPLLGDIDGDGKADLVVWRRGNGTFYWLTSSTGYSYATGQGQKQWGSVVGGVPDVPILGNIDGDKKADLIFARTGTNEFHWLTSSSKYNSATAGAYYAGVGFVTNQAPVVSAGSNQSITLPALASLNGSATDDGLPAGSALSRAWSTVSGPGAVTYGSVNAQTTTATFSAAGVYVLRLTASDGALSTYADVSITVNAPNCIGVTVLTSTPDLQAVVNAYPEGTTFCFKAGTYRLAGPVLAKSRDRFIGQSGTILDGGGTVARAIWGYGGPTGQSNVVVQGLALANFTDSAIVTGWYWTVSHNDIHDSQIGVTINSYSTLDSNYIHDNRQYGLTGGPGADMLIVNNELARNNTSNECGGGCPGDAGASKIIGSAVGTTGLVWRNNNVHDNTGHGIWSDGNVRALYEGNIVSSNSGAGIFHEISWDAIIRNNTLTNNDSEAIGKSCWWGANILINTSSNVEVYGNTITASNGSNGICAVSSDRPDAIAPYPTTVANFYVHDNVVSMTGSATSGLVGYAGSNNRFVHNTYQVTNVSSTWWTWPTAYTATWAAWLGTASQDTDGILKPW